MRTPDYSNASEMAALVARLNVEAMVLRSKLAEASAIIDSSKRLFLALANRNPRIKEADDFDAQSALNTAAACDGFLFSSGLEAGQITKEFAALLVERDEAVALLRDVADRLNPADDYGRDLIERAHAFVSRIASKGGARFQSESKEKQ